MHAPVEIASIDDPRVAVYRNLRDRDLLRDGGRFIAEGLWIVRRLFSSGLTVESVLVARRRMDDLAADLPPGVTVYRASDAVIDRIVGFAFHSGVIACGIRPQRRTATQVIPHDDSPVRVVICPQLTVGENVGAVVRTAAGFGATAILLGSRCIDPFTRISVRVSMGTVFRLPIGWLDDPASDLIRMRDEYQLEHWATVIDPSAEPLDRAIPPKRLAIWVGNEADGLPSELVQLCDRRVQIPMHHGTDSLNVAIATAVFLYEVTRDRSG